MAIKYSYAIRDNQLDQIDKTIGKRARLHIYSGQVPANCSEEPTGLKLLEILLPSSWMSASSFGVKSKDGDWIGFGSEASGEGTEASYFRIYDTTNSICHIQGTVGLVGSGQDMELSDTVIANGQMVVIGSFTVMAGNG